MDLNDIKAFIFDMDGLIFDTERLFIEAWLRVPEAKDLPGIVPLLKECIGIRESSAKALFLRAYGEGLPYDELRKKAVRQLWEAVPDRVLPMLPGAEDMLVFLQSLGRPIVLASSTPEAVVRRELSDAGLTGYFTWILGGDNVERSKPAPDLFLAAAEKAGAEPKNCLVFEDSYNGIRAAHAAGMIPFMIPDQLPPTDEMKNLAAAIFPSLGEAQEYLRSISL